MIRNSVKNGQLKSRNLSEEKKTHPSTNILLILLQNSEKSFQWLRTNYHWNPIANAVINKNLVETEAKNVWVDNSKPQNLAGLIISRILLLDSADLYP